MKLTVFHLIAFFSLIFISCSQNDQRYKYSGDWFGVLNLGESKFNLAFHINSEDRNASFYIADPKAEFIRVDTIYIEDDSLEITISEIDGAYKCAIYMNKLYGKWKLANDRWVNMTFERVDFDNVVGFHPRLDENYQYKQPQQREDKWLTSTLEEETTHFTRIYDLVKDIINEKYKDIHSLLIVKNNKLVLEEYFYGYSADDLNGIQSASKSFWSALLGIAFQQGAIKDINQSICPYVTEYEKINCQDQNVNIYHLLTMTAGWEWDETSINYDDPKNSSDQMVTSDDPLLFTLSSPKGTSPGESFNYNSGCMLLINKILFEATKTPNEAFAIENLLEPLGITNYYLGEPENGVLGDIELLPRDMAKFGALFLNRGKWDDKQILPKSWVAEATTKQISTGGQDNEGYGYFWWTRSFKREGKATDCYYAWGYGGQYIFVVPEMNMVVVFTGSSWKMNDPTYFEIMDNYLIE